MHDACAPHEGLTPMAAVAGAVADAVLRAMLQAARLDRAYVNNGGDIAFHVTPGHPLRCGLVPDLAAPAIDGLFTLDHAQPSRGIATSGRACKGPGRGAVSRWGSPTPSPSSPPRPPRPTPPPPSSPTPWNLPHSPVIHRRPARDIDPDSDLGPRLVTWDLGPLSPHDIDRALDAGRAVADAMRRARADPRGGAHPARPCRDLPPIPRIEGRMIRKITVIVEETHEEGGQPIAPPTRKAAAIAVVQNPYAGQFQRDLEVLVDLGERLGWTLGKRAVAALGIEPHQVPQLRQGRHRRRGRRAGTRGRHPASEARRTAPRRRGGRRRPRPLRQEARRHGRPHRRAPRPQGRRLRAQPLRRHGGSASPTRPGATRSWSRSSSPTAAARCPASAASKPRTPSARTACVDRNHIEGDHAMITRRLILGTTAATLATPGLIRAQSTSAPIRIGEINSYTAQPAFTLPYRNGWQLALDQVNASGGVLGRKLEIVSRDDAGRPQDAVRIAGELVNDAKVDLLAGTFLSNIGLAVSDFALQNKVLFVGGEPLSDALIWDKGNRYTFRLRPGTYMQSAMLVEEAAKLPAKRWVTVAPNYEYGQSAVKWFKQLLSAKAPRRRVRGRAMAGPGPHRRRRHGRRPRRAEARCAVQRHLRRRPHQLRPPRQHPRALREAQRRLHAHRRARIPRAARRRDPRRLDRHRLPRRHHHHPRAPPVQHGLSRQVRGKRRNAAPWSASRWSTASWPASSRPAAPGPRPWRRASRAPSSKPPSAAPPSARWTTRPPLGAYVGKLGLKDGKGAMLDWKYVDGAAALPTDDAVKAMRPG